jgi:sulfur carrier protein ThiS
MTGISLSISVDGTTERIELDGTHSIIDLLRRLGILPDTVLVMRDGCPVPLTETVIDDDHLRVIRVASGG